MSWEYCTSGAAISYAGKLAPSVSGSSVILARWYVDAAGNVGAAMRKDFSGSFSSLNPSVQGVVAEATAAQIGNKIVAWDPNNYTSRIEAEDIININRDVYLRGLSILRDKKTQDFITNA